MFGEGIFFFFNIVVIFNQRVCVVIIYSSFQLSTRNKMAHA